MGDVWEAVLHGPSGFRKPVALKILRRQDGEACQQGALLEEARMGALLHHPNIVATLDLAPLVAPESGWAIAMELVRGVSLGELVRERPLGTSALLDAGIQACAGLQHIHALRVAGRPAGLIHRDIKPDNLLLDQSGLVKVADLGVARLQGVDGGIAGTPGYMPAEQAEGREDSRSDLFALGVTLFALATGRKPFGGGPAAVIGVQRVDTLMNQPGFFTALDGRPDGLADVLRRCMRANPADRFPTAADLGAALRALRDRLHDPADEGLLDRLATARPDLDVETPSAHAMAAATEVDTVLHRRGNLPPPRDRFVGRHLEVSELLKRIGDGERLVTILGPGGMGKTRLGLVAARGMEHALGGGAWFVDASEARGIDGMCAAMATALRLELDRKDPVEQVGYALRALGPCVVVLDNLEQVATAAGSTIGRWLDLAPNATLIATSRVALQIRREGRLDLGPLTADTGLALFLERAPRTIPPDQQPQVAQIVAQLEGMPLALELAAARTRVLTVAQVAARLVDRLHLLAGGDRDRPLRQQSLRASLDGSWELLSSPARSGLAQLSVFEGGFTLEAAEAVVALAEERTWVLEVIEVVVNSSLVRTSATGDRFTMLVVIQEFAATKLENAADTHTRHATFFAQAGTREALAALRGPGGPDRARLLARDLDNLVDACRTATHLGLASVAAATGLAAAEVLAAQGPVGVIPGLLQDVLDLADLPHSERQRVAGSLGLALTRTGGAAIARPILDGAVAAAAEGSGELGQLLAYRGACLAKLGHYEEAATDMLEAQQQLQGSSDRIALANTQLSLAGIQLTLGHVDQSRISAESGLHQLVTAGDLAGQAAAYRQLGNWYLDQGRPDDARERYEQAVVIDRATDQRRATGIDIGNLGIALAQLGRSEEAQRCYGQALASARQAGDRESEGMILGNLGALARDLGHLDEAEARLNAALNVHVEQGNRRLEGIVRSNLGVTMLDRGAVGAARKHYQRALEIHREVGNRRSAGIALTGLGSVALRAGDLEEAGRTYLEGLAIHHEVRNARFEGITLGSLGHVAARRGDLAQARDLYERAVALHRETQNLRFVGKLLFDLSRLDVAEGNLADAAARLRASMIASEAIDYAGGVAHALAALAVIGWRQGDTSAAEVQATRVLEGSAADPNAGSIARMVLAAIQCEAGQHEAATRLVRGAPVSVAPSVELLVLTAQVHQLLGPPEAVTTAVQAAEALVASDAPTSPAARELARLRSWLDQKKARTPK